MLMSFSAAAEPPVIINNNNNNNAANAASGGGSGAPGMVIFNDVWAGALAGGMLGLSGGVYAYGLKKNSDPRQITLSALYGFLGGSALGLGMGFMEYGGSLPHGTGKNLGTYVSAGTGMGALFGLLIALIPYVTEEPIKDNFYYGTLGVGLGGLLGGGLGVLVAVLDTQQPSARAANSPEIRLGIMPEHERMTLGEKHQPALELQCRLLEMRY
jgi:hypothetical protein